MPTFRDDPKLGCMVPMMKTDDINDQAITKDKIRDGNVTTEKLADGAVSTDKLPDGAIKTSKIADENITTEKLAEGAVETSKIADQNVTSEKIADQSVDNSKLSPEAVTYDKVKDKAIITEKLNDRAVTTEKVEERAITNPKLGNQSVDGRVVREASLETKHFANGSVTTEKIKDSSVTNEKVADDTLGIEKFDPELRKIIQAATGLPEDLSQMIQDVDKSVKQLKEKDTDLQSQINDKQQQITANDGDISLLQTRSTQMEKAIKGISASGGASQASAVTYENTESGLDSITAQGAIDELANKKFNKENISQEFGDSKDKVVSQSALPFRYIQNEEFIFAKVDANDKFLFGIQWDGTPKFGKPSLVEDRLQSQVNLLADKITAILGDDNTTSAIDTLKELKNFFAGIDNTQTLTSILANLNAAIDKVAIKDEAGEIQDTPFRVIDNEEYLAVEQDAEGKLLSATNPDGSHYIYNAKSETIPEEFSHIEDPEGRTEITTDAEDKIIGYRDSEGTRHEHKISANHLNLSDEAAKEVNEAFKSAGIKMENPSDFSKDSYIELPIPRIAAQVRLYAPKLPTTKQDDIEAEIEYNDKDGNYFRKPVILNAQGSSSMSYFVKNMAIDLNDGSEIKFGDFPTQDSFHLKKYYIDAFRGQCIVGYWLIEQVYKSRPIGQQYPYEYSYSNGSTTDGLGDVKKDFFTGAKCHPDGFPIVITWVNSETGEKTEMGIYAWNLKKSKEVYNCDKKKAENIILDGYITNSTLFGGTVGWSQYEIRNPKSLIDKDGNKYDGDNPKELSDTDKTSKKVKEYIIRLSHSIEAINNENSDELKKEKFKEYFLLDMMIDYFLQSQVVYNFDGFEKNWIWITHNGLQWCPTIYDEDSIFGAWWNGTYVQEESAYFKILGNDSGFITGYLSQLFNTELCKRYKELRDKGIFSVDNIMLLLTKWTHCIGYDNYKKEIGIYPETPSYRDSKLNPKWKVNGLENANKEDTFDINKTYSKNDICIYKGYSFSLVADNCLGEPPITGSYVNAPNYLGFYNSSIRVKNWLTKRITFLDSEYNYN